MPFYADLTVVSALLSDALLGGDGVPSGAAAGSVAPGKLTGYPNCSFTLFVIEDYGWLGKRRCGLCV